MVGQLTLMDAVDSYQQGLDYGEKMKERNTRDAAGKAFNTALDGERTRWMEAQKAQGIEASPDAFKPDQAHYFNAAQAASQEYAKAGDWRGFMDQQVKLAPMRTQARATALQDFKFDGDMPRLVRRFYETVPDGGSFTKVEMVDGAGPDGKTAAPMVRMHLADGRVVMKPQSEVLQRITSAIQDPAKAAERDAELALFTAKNNIETAGKVKVEEVKGGEARKTEGVKAGYEREKVGLQTAGALEVARQQGLNSAETARIHAGATLGAAGIGANATLGAARIRADADVSKPVVYGADQNVGLFSATPGGGRTFTPAAVASPGGKRMTTEQLLGAATHQFGDLPQGALGGSRIGGEKVTAIAARANQIRTQNPNISDDQALMQAGAEYGHKYPSRTQVLGLADATPAGGKVVQPAKVLGLGDAAPASGPAAQPTSGTGRVVDFGSLR